MPKAELQRAFPTEVLTTSVPSAANDYRPEAGSDHALEAGNDHKMDEDKEKRTGDWAAIKKQKLSDEQQMFACPFFKRDPVRYKNYRTCLGPGWTSLHRIK